MFLLSSCGLLKVGEGVAEPQSYSFNGVKLIRPDISKGDDARTMLQSQYSISNFSRLLLRFEDFLSKVDSISLGNGRRVNVHITVDGSSGVNGSDVNQAQTDLVLCPVLTNWMMLATWYKAYPMGNSGVWKAQGGDYLSEACIAASSHVDDTLQFDVTDWVVNYAIGRHQNYGLLLISNSSSTYGILGDTNGANSPRIEWLKQ